MKVILKIVMGFVVLQMLFILGVMGDAETAAKVARETHMTPTGALLLGAGMLLGLWILLQVVKYRESQPSVQS